MPKPASFERIRVRMLSKWLLDAHDSCTVIAFTSRLPGEGVSTVVAGLARAFGATDPGKVLVLETVPGRKTVADLLHVKAPRVSFDGFGNGGTGIASFVSDEEQGISILTLSKDRGLTTGPKGVQSLLDRFRASYQVILVDAGALTEESAAIWLARSNYRVLVVDAGLATREVLEHLRNELDHRGILLHGSILNKRTYPVPDFVYRLVH